MHRFRLEILLLTFLLAGWLPGTASAAVAADCSTPLQIQPIPTLFAHRGFPVNKSAVANRLCGIQNWSTTSGTPGFSVDGAGGLFYWTPVSTGTFAITISLTETVGSSATTVSRTFTAIVDDNTMTVPAWRDYRTESAFIDIVGRAAGTRFVSYTLAYRASSSTDAPWTPIVGPVRTPVPTDGFLGRWSVSSLPDGGRYTLRLSVDQSDGTVSTLENEVILDRTLKPGWSRRVGPLTHSPTVVDLDDDGNDEVAVLSHFGILHVWDIQGRARWQVPASSTIGFGSAFSGVSAGDLEGDGRPELFFTTTDRLYAYHGDGSAVLGFPVSAPAGYQFRATPTVYDLDRNGVLEILVTARNNNPAAPSLVAVYAYDRVARRVVMASGWPQGTSHFSAYHSPSIADLNRDGSPDVVVASYQRVFAWDRFGRPVPGWSGGVAIPIPIANAFVNGAGSFQSTSKPAIADLDRDGDLEIVVGPNALSADGRVLPGWLAGRTGVPASVSAAIGDIDGIPSNGLEASIGKSAFRYSGSVLGGFPLPQELASTIAIDCGSEEHLDIVGGTRLYYKPGVLGFHPEPSGPEVRNGYPKSLYGETGDTGAPVVGDFDNDGRVDVAVGITDGSYGGIVAVYAMATENHDERHDWRMLGHDVAQTGTWVVPDPDRPAGAAVTSRPDGLLVTWQDRSAVENGYLVERSATGAPFTYQRFGLLLPANTTSFLDSSVRPGQTAYYRIRAVRFDPQNRTRRRSMFAATSGTRRAP